MLEKEEPVDRTGRPTTSQVLPNTPSSNTTETSERSVTEEQRVVHALEARVASHTVPKPLPKLTDLSVSSASSHSDILQRSFDLFCRLDTEHKHVLTIHQLKEALSIFASQDGAPCSADDAEMIMHIVGVSENHLLNFSQFHSIYAAICCLRSISLSDTGDIRLRDVRRALNSVGITPTESQLESMFLLHDEYESQHRSGPISFTEFLSIYVQPWDSTHMFLHSWYHAGRNSIPYNKPIQISPMQDFIAGTGAGIALTLVGHPFDTLKVRLQTEQRFTSLWDCVLQTWKKEKIWGFFKGMGGPLATVPLVNAIVFWAYAHGKDALHSMQKERRPLTLVETSIAGAFAGFVNSFVICPVELVKTHLQTQYSPRYVSSFRPMVFATENYVPPQSTSSFANRSYSTSTRPLFRPQDILHELSQSSTSATGNPTARPTIPSPASVLMPPGSRPTPSPSSTALLSGPIQCLSTIYTAEGFRGLFRGLSATIYREIPGYGAQFFMYETIKQALTPVGGRSSDLSAPRVILAGGFAGIFGWAASYPMDFVKSQLQAEPIGQPSAYKKNPYLFDGGFFDCLKQTVKRKGYRELWRGFAPCVLRAFPANAAGFATYELTLKMIKNLD